MSASQALRAILRINAAVCLLALIPAFMPRQWIDISHDCLGLGPIPEAPVFEYLARSISLLYAGMGVVAWILSTDLARYSPLICLSGIGYIVFGAALLSIDFRAGLPLWWVGVEGPFVMVIGVVILAVHARARGEIRQGQSLTAGRT